MTSATSVQARVQGDTPVWDEDAKMWLSKLGTTELAYMNYLDSVNTASVEGALMFVQAEGINVNDQSVLGDLNIDDLVGITKMGYSSYEEFCEDGGVEFKASNTGSGFEVEESIEFLGEAWR
uniref:Uncharacterized protein n=1 Tax=Peronospora matthiolae TaxID=2874970 RepID=A0AAV1TWJ5_9STRA